MIKFQYVSYKAWLMLHTWWARFKYFILLTGCEMCTGAGEELFSSVLLVHKR